jgi:hypothetical protein
VSQRCSVPEHIFIGEAEFPKDADDIRELSRSMPRGWLAMVFHGLCSGPRSGMIGFRSWRRFRGSTLLLLFCAANLHPTGLGTTTRRCIP